MQSLVKIILLDELPDDSLFRKTIETMNESKNTTEELFQKVSEKTGQTITRVKLDLSQQIEEMYRERRTITN